MKPIRPLLHRITRSSSQSLTLSLAAVTFALILLSTDVAFPQTPTPVVERWLDVGDRMVRTSLFSNRVLVVSVLQGGERVLFQRIELPENEYMGYLAAFLRDAKELSRAEDRLMTESLGGSGKIILHVGPKAPLTIEYSPVAVLDLATSRLVAVLDDLERRVIWGVHPEADLLGWQPRRGDRVELRSGNRATVVDVYDDGTVVLEHDGIAIHERVPPESLSSVILRVLEDEP